MTDFEKQLYELKSVLMKDDYKRHVDFFIKKLNEYIIDAKIKYTEVCPKMPSNEPLSVILQYIKKNFDSDILNALFKLALVHKNRPEYIYNKPAMKLFLILLGYAVLIENETLLKTAFKAYIYKTFHLIFAKRFRICDPDVMLLARDKASKKSTLAKYQFNIDKYLEDRYNQYLNYILHHFKRRDFIEAFKNITVAMDYAKNNLNIGIKSLADIYYKLYNLRSKGQLKTSSIQQGLNIQLFYRSIYHSVFTKLNDKDYLNRIKIQFIPREKVYCLCEKLTTTHTDYLEDIVKMYLKLLSKIKEPACSSEWLKYLNRLLISKDLESRKLKKLFTDFFKSVQDECGIKQYVDVIRYNLELRKFFHVIIVDTIYRHVCSKK